MTKMDSNELDLVRASLRHTIDTAESTEAIGRLLTEGWLELVDAEPADAITILAEEAGRARSALPVVDLAVLWGAGLDPAAGTAAVLPPMRHDAPGTALFDGDVDGLVLAAQRAERFVIPTGDRMVSIPAALLTLEPVRGWDPHLDLARVTGAPSATDIDEVSGAQGAALAISAGRLALASQMVGAAEQMLADTVQYVLLRHQYNRAIGSFQAVQHRLADVHVATGAAQAAIAAAWQTGDHLSATAAKCLAGRAQALASKHCVQVHGGIAFTVEHGFHSWLRRGHLLDALLGSTTDLTRLVGEVLLQRGEVPRVPSLTS